MNHKVNFSASLSLRFSDGFDGPKKVQFEEAYFLYLIKVPLNSSFKEGKESELRELAKAARAKRSGLAKSPKKETSEINDEDEVRERDEIRRQRHEQRKREHNIARAAPGKQYVLDPMRDTNCCVGRSCARSRTEISRSRLRSASRRRNPEEMHCSINGCLERAREWIQDLIVSRRYSFWKN